MFLFSSVLTSFFSFSDKLSAPLSFADLAAIVGEVCPPPTNVHGSSLGLVVSSSAIGTTIVGSSTGAGVVNPKPFVNMLKKGGSQRLKVGARPIVP